MLGATLLRVLFFGSGVAALLYQLAWQRSLFVLYGVNLESVTAVVTSFMLGLGLGAVAGGEISRRWTGRVGTIFGALELGLALFGLFSLALLRAVGEATVHLPAVLITVLPFLLLLLPTTMMGATLPLLITHEVHRTGNVGRSVAGLYFANTLGSAAACFAAVFTIFPSVGLSGAVRVACALNLLVGAVALVRGRVRPGAA